MTNTADGIPIEGLAVNAYRIPTDAPEADGTFEWSSTVLITVEAQAGGQTGLGYTYGSPAAASVIIEALADAIEGLSPFDVERTWSAMVRSVRNAGWQGIAACAISAVDTALWDLKARLLEVPLARLFGMARDSVPIYGSGGFTSYDDERLVNQLGYWVHELGCRWVKMKIGAHPEDDYRRMLVARRAIGDAGLMIDANGAFSRKPALAMAEQGAALGVVWFEEPVSSDDLVGLRLLRDRAPATMEIAAGEYGFEPFYFRRMLETGAVDVLQADATRCLGYTGFIRVAALAENFGVPLSAHTAPALHVPVCSAVPGMKHIEWFHDHVRIERELFEGAPVPIGGDIAPDLSRPGHGLALRRGDAERYRL